MSSSPTTPELVDVPDDYDVVSSTTDFRSGRVIDVRTDQVRMPDGATAARDVVVHPGAVGVIALDEADRVLLLRQYRHPVRRRLWEPPAGLLDEPGEDPLTAAKRELYEEAHYQAGRWDVLVDIYTSPGMTDEAARIYLARDVEPATAERFAGSHEESDMELAWFSLPDAVSAVLAGRVHNPLAVTGLLAAEAARRDGFRQLRPADVPWPEMSSFTGSGQAN
ncbi:MAG TPA: NUDIX hydrolase [Mycobacteriales bacterium]|jgi:ADP-ribose pyrophosphatase|nr:NUDIX hydrolase [Mycobacteriales bacterium]